MTKKHPLMKLLALVFAVALVGAACSDSDDESSDTTEAPATTEAGTEETTADTEAAGEQNIVETAVAAGDFTTLATVLEAAGLVETLEGEGPFTVFAPTDDAFEALPDGTLDELLADPEALSDILLYHVVEGEVPGAQVVELDSATTVEGSDVSITVDGDTVMVNDATVTMTDIQASNGVIHVIDTVLLPPES